MSNSTKAQTRKMVMEQRINRTFRYRLWHNPGSPTPWEAEFVNSSDKVISTRAEKDRSKAEGWYDFWRTTVHG